MIASTRFGMTLVELVITIATAAILGVPTGLLISEHLQQSIQLRDSNLAAQLGRYELERLDGLNSFFAADLTVGTTAITNYQNYPYTVTRTVTCQIGNCVSAPPSTVQGVKRIEITVTKSGSATQLIRLITYRTKYVTFS